MKRYAWCDAVNRALGEGVISNATALFLHRAATAINWVPRKGESAALRWSNVAAAPSLGISRSSFQEHAAKALSAGLLVKRGGNYCPEIPEPLVSRNVDTHEEDRTAEVSRNLDMVSENLDRVSEYLDTCSEDSFSDNSFSESNGSMLKNSGNGTAEQVEAPEYSEPERFTGTGEGISSTLRRGMESQEGSRSYRPSWRSD